MSDPSDRYARRAPPAAVTTVGFGSSLLALLLLSTLTGCGPDERGDGAAPAGSVATPAGAGETLVEHSGSSADAVREGLPATPRGPSTAPPPRAADATPALDTDAVASAARLIGLELTPAERALMLGELERHRAAYAALRDVRLANDVPPRAIFEAPRAACTPDVPPDAGAPTTPADLDDGLAVAPPAPTSARGDPTSRAASADPRPMTARAAAAPAVARAAPLERPADLEALAFASVAELGELIRTRTVSVTELTGMFLDRLERRGEELAAVVTLTRERALAQAAELDRELAAGRYRGPLHGIPYGAKDLIAVAGYPTTWGAAPFRDQTLATTASVISRLDAAGAVLVAKLSLGALAWGDVWYGGRTLNPWNLDQGSSGSSAGSAASVAAGLLPFALGSETLGSIVSPATRVGVTGLRPTFGRVSRHGVMSLAWSMDKVGLLCRDVESCAAVFPTIAGCDGIDASVVAAPFDYPGGRALAGMRVGYAAAELARPHAGREQAAATLAVLADLGAELVPIELPDLPVDSLTIILFAEAAAAFDELTRSGDDDLLVRQVEDAWPNVFRAARFIPAVEYIQANRVRTLLAEAMAERLADVDVYLAPSQGTNLALTNLTGHPAVVLPNGFADERTPTSITFIGKPFDEATVLAVAARYQAATTHHLRHPPLFATAGGD